MQKSHAKGEPFFTLTQNALCDGTYLDYAREMYGHKIYIPDMKDSERCLAEYMADASRRAKDAKLYPAEDVKEVNGRIQVAGQVSLMIINGLLGKVIFDKNPEREFYIEESFPLDWMYPHLEPHGLIMKINRQPLTEISEELVRRDRDYWVRLMDPMIGNWLNEDTPVKTIADFVEKVFLRGNLDEFDGDRRFARNGYTQQMFSKERSGIAGLYSWRLGVSPNCRPPSPEYLPKSETERLRMIKAADFAYRQSWALCPHSPEAVFRYVGFLENQNRFEDALLVADTAAKFPIDPQIQRQFQDLANRMRVSNQECD
jgi:hypothetical protein